MIGQIETAKSVPTISLLCRVAEALDVEFVNLLATPHTRRMVVLRREQAKTVEASAGKFTMRALFQQDRSRVKFFEVRIAPLHTEVAEPWASGTHAKLVVTRGNVAVSMEGEPIVKLSEGDVLLFQADVAHTYRNIVDAQSVLYLVTSDPEPTER
jgi:quercetin dioxygenase-like cupin family protein